MNVKKKNSFAMLICMFGVVIASIIKEVLHLNSSIAVLMMGLGALLLLKYRTKVSIRLVIKEIPIILYLLLAFLYGLFSGYSFSSDYSPVIYVLYSLAIALIMLMHKSEEVDTEFFVKSGWWITGVFSVLLIPLLTNNFTTFSSISRLSQGSDRLTLAVIGIAYLIFILVYKPVNTLEKIIKWLFAVSAILVILLCNVRRAVLGYAFILVYHFLRYTDQSKFRKRIYELFRILIFILIFLVVVYRFQIIRELFERLIAGTRSVTLGYFGRESGRYNSGAIRNDSITRMWEEYTTTFSIKDYIFGKGYMYKHIDFPLFQAFSDLGIIGGLLFLYIQIVLVIRELRVVKMNAMHQFLQYYLLSTLLTCFYSGTPYGYDKFIPLLFLLSVNRSKTVKPGGFQ